MNGWVHWAALGVLTVGLGMVACGDDGESKPGSGGDGAGASGGGSSTGGSSTGGSSTGGSSTGGGGSNTGGDGGEAGSGGSNAGGDGGSSTGGSGGDGGSAPVVARLFVSMADDPVAVWEDVDTIAVDSGPSFSLQDASVANGARGLALASDRLFVGGEGASALLLAFDAAATLTQATAPTATIPAAQFISAGGSEGADLITVDGASDSVWTTTFAAGTELFGGASSMTSAATADALFSHAWQQLPAFAYDASGDRAFLGQISGAGVVVWNNALGASGTPAQSFTLASNVAAWSMAIAEDRLYAIGAHGGAPPAESISVWDGVSSLSAPSAPTFTMGTGSGIAVNDFSPYVAVQNNVLIACIQAGKVLLWDNASALSGEAAPSQTLTGLSSPRKAILGPTSGRLYVLESDGVSIFDSPTTAPVLAVKLSNGVASTRDMALLE